MQFLVVIVLQRGFSSLVHTHAERTQEKLIGLVNCGFLRRPVLKTK